MIYWSQMIWFTDHMSVESRVTSLVVTVKWFTDHMSVESSSNWNDLLITCQ